MNMQNSPCFTCTRVKNPQDCENKQCPPWRSWFLRRWEQLRQQFGAEKIPVPGEDPCGSCLCPKELCVVPCAKSLAWEKNGRNL